MISLDTANAFPHKFQVVLPKVTISKVQLPLDIVRSTVLAVKLC